VIICQNLRWRRW